GYVADGACDLVVGAGGVAAHSEATNAFVLAVERHAAAERDDTTADAAQRWLRVRTSQARRGEGIGLGDAVEGLPGLAQRIHARRGQRRGVGAEGIRRECLGYGDGTAAGPGRGSVIGGDRQRTKHAVAVHDGAPLELAGGESASLDALRCLAQHLAQRAAVRQSTAIACGGGLGQRWTGSRDALL